ncbi:transglycosylase domain-containing protein [Nonomuraea spiralis]|uniref:transglycosylase domain-containing protein n=1 Tax=Nonomuraea spiralis TaxID=46182 RepID=UPI0037B6ECDD
MPNRLSNIVRLTVAAVSAGLLAAAITLPAVGGTGTLVVSATEELNLKPMVLEEPPLSQTSTVYDAEGNVIARFYDQNREVVRLDQIAGVMRTAIVAIEDDRFYEHGPIDVEGTLRALVTNFTSNRLSQGGSSITQQYVKQVLLNAADSEQDKNRALEASYARKLNELRYAMGVEQKYGKDEILRRYLNIAYFGAGANGVQAAAKRFFGVPAAKLDLAQAATLAGAVQDPNTTDPNRGKKARALLLTRRNVVLDRMAQLGRITPQQAAAAKAKKLGFRNVRQPNGCGDSSYPYFCEYVRHELLGDPAFGRTQRARERAFAQGGLKIYTTLDPKAQAAAEQAIKKHVNATDNALAAEALVQPGTGAIRAMAASRAYGSSARKKQISFNAAADMRHGGLIGFQAGSTFKTFTLVTALKQGMKVDDGINVGNGYNAPSTASFKNCRKENIGDPSWTVTNDEGSPGFKTLRTGTWGSVNTFFMALQERVGLCPTVETAKSLGIVRADGNKLQEFETFTLGINETDPVTVANAYAAIAARGKYCEPTAITKITDAATGRTTSYRPSCRQALDPGVADATAHVLQGVFTKGTMRSVGGIGRPAAGKTGTTDKYASAWFAGFTPDLAGAVSIGDPRGSQRHRLVGTTIGGRYFPYVAGASLPGPIWKDTMTAALKGVPARAFTPLDTGRFGGCDADCAPDRPTQDPDRILPDPDQAFADPDQAFPGQDEDLDLDDAGEPGGAGRMR